MEALISILLLGMVIGLASGLLQELSKVRRHLAGKGRTQTALAALENMAAEVAQSTQILQPSNPGVNASELELRRLNSNSSTRMAPLTTSVSGWPDGQYWLPQDPNQTIRVRYFMGADRQLLREVGGISELASTGLSSLTCRLQGNSIRISVSVEEERKVEVLTRLAFRWVR